MLHKFSTLFFEAMNTKLIPSAHSSLKDYGWLEKCPRPTIFARLVCQDYAELSKVPDILIKY